VGSIALAVGGGDSSLRPVPGDRRPGQGLHEREPDAPGSATRTVPESPSPPSAAARAH